MDVAALQKTASRAKWARNIMTIVAGGLLVLNVMLGTVLVTQSNQVVLVPTQPARGMVARGAVDKHYVEALAKDAIYALYNASPGSAEYARVLLDRMSSTEHRPAVLSAYERSIADLQERKVTTAFVLDTLTTSADGLRVEAQGILKTYLENRLIGGQERVVVLEFKVEASTPRLVSIARKEPDDA